MEAAQTTENHEDEWDVAWYLRWGIHTSVATWIHSQNSPEAATELSLKTSPHGLSLKWSQRPSQPAEV